MSENIEELTEIQEAHLLRALDIICNSWEENANLTIEEMTVHLEKTIDVVDNRITFQEFLKATHLDKYERLN